MLYFGFQKLGIYQLSKEMVKDIYAMVRKGYAEGRKGDGCGRDPGYYKRISEKI